MKICRYSSSFWSACVSKMKLKQRRSLEKTMCKIKDKSTWHMKRSMLIVSQLMKSTVRTSSRILKRSMTRQPAMMKNPSPMNRMNKRSRQGSK